MSKDRPRRIERQITASDLAERLMPDLHMNELLLWSPDLFAFTSYIMSQTGAYQTVVSPPMNKTWLPLNRDIRDLISTENHILKWLEETVKANTEEHLDKLKKNNSADYWIFDASRWIKKVVSDDQRKQGYTQSNYLSDSIIKNLLEKPNWSNTDKESHYTTNLERVVTHVWIKLGESLKTSIFDREVNRLKRISQNEKTNKNFDFGEVAKKEIELIEFRCPELKQYFIEGQAWDEIVKSRTPKLNPLEEAAFAEYDGIITQRYETDRKDTDRFKNFSLDDLLSFDNEQHWVQFIQLIGDEWENNLNQIDDTEFFIINDGERQSDCDKEPGELHRNEDGTIIQWKNKVLKELYEFSESNPRAYINRESDLLGILLKRTPPILIALWAYFYNEVTDNNFYGNENRTLRISELLCNQDFLQIKQNQNPNTNQNNTDRLWKINVALVSMHAAADICCTSWGLKSVERTATETGGNDSTETSNVTLEASVSIGNKELENIDYKNRLTAQLWAERLLFCKGSLSLINTERCRVLPKRHNPQVGITLRSISSNLAFHRSSVEVVWRKSVNTRLEQHLSEGKDTISVLLIPYPFEVKSKDFKEDFFAAQKVGMADKYKFFNYISPPTEDPGFNEMIHSLITKAQEEVNEKNQHIDAVIMPETALSRTAFIDLEDFLNLQENCPSLLISGVSESRDEVSRFLTAAGQRELKKDQINFNRNAVYCKYHNTSQKSNRKQTDDDENDSSYGFGKPTQKKQTPKYVQYKHHRWKLDGSQIDRYGLSQALDDDKFWWESIKIPRRRVSFLNVGNKITIANLICEDLARQDPIADLIRHVGPSLVVTLLMDGPQLKNRWSSRYASILSDDPGSSVITLTSFGMVKRHSSSFGLLSRVVALWSESDGMMREIELAGGARAILLNLKLSPKKEKTADGRQERMETMVLRLKDVIQIYPKTSQ